MRENATMDLTKFHDALVASVLSPLERCERETATTARILEQELGAHTGIPANIADDIARAPLHELEIALCAMHENGNYSATGQHFADFQKKLRNAISFERREGRLKPITQSGEIEKNLLALRGIGFRGIEYDALKATLKDGERILEVAVRFIRTSTRSIGRCELIDVLKPSTQTNRGAWEGQFPGEPELAEREQAAQRAANPVPPSFDNYNRDLPRPMRMDRQ